MSVPGEIEFGILADCVFRLEDVRKYAEKYGLAHEAFTGWEQDTQLKRSKSPELKIANRPNGIDLMNGDMI